MCTEGPTRYLLWSPVLSIQHDKYLKNGCDLPFCWNPEWPQFDLFSFPDVLLSTCKRQPAHSLSHLLLASRILSLMTLVRSTFAARRPIDRSPLSSFVASVSLSANRLRMTRSFSYHTVIIVKYNTIQLHINRKKIIEIQSDGRGHRIGTDKRGKRRGPFGWIDPGLHLKLSKQT